MDRSEPRPGNARAGRRAGVRAGRGLQAAAARRAVLSYLEEDNIIHSLDMATRAKGKFLERFRDVILEPRGLGDKIRLPGPTGTNAVEACLKLARKLTGRRTMLYFRGAFQKVARLPQDQLA